MFIYSGLGGVAVCKSTDIGRTWSEAWLLQLKGGLAYTGHPALLPLTDGKIMFSYSVHNLTTDSLEVKGDQHQ